MIKILLGCLLGLCLCFLFARGASAGDPGRKTWEVNGVEREALVYLPPSAGPGLPVVFCFHGHGGDMAGFSEIYPIHRLWPEAVAVWPQGLPTPGKINDPEGKRSGWQYKPGMLEDRDLRFVDAMLAWLRAECRIDPGRVYAFGFSNGGGFTYVLWAARRDDFAAFAPMATIADEVLDLLRPGPAFVAGGSLDRMVTPAMQALMFDRIREINQCTGETEQAGDEPLNLLHSSALGLRTESYYYPKGHEHDPETPGLMVNFFKKVDAARNGQSAER
jgi:polyhydroxybutyrate depolymerase